MVDLNIQESENKQNYTLPIDKIIQIQTLAKAISTGTDSENAAQNDDSAILSSDTRDKIAEAICADAGITDLPCWQDLKAMRQKESYDGKAMVGDRGKKQRVVPHTDKNA